MTTETQEKQAQDLWNSMADERSADEPTQQVPSEAEAVEVVEDPEDAAPAAEEVQVETPAAEEDPYKDLSPKLKEEIENLKSLAKLVPELKEQLTRTSGRVASLQSEHDAAKAAAKIVKDAPTQAQITAASKSTEKWDGIKADFPDWAEATEQLLNARLADVKPGENITADAIARVIDERVAEAESKQQKALEEAKVEGKYPDWLDTLKDADFHTWKDAQPDEVKSLFTSPKGRDAIRMLDLYAEAKAKPAETVQAKRAAKLAAAASKAPGQSGAVTKTVAEMTPEELWDYEAKRAQKKNADSGLRY